jgi:UDP-glucose 4-epimerase
VNSVGLQAAGEVTAQVAEALRGRRILVTGASGFVGARLCERLESLGAQVLGLARSEPVSGNPPATWLRADLGDPESARAAIGHARADVIMHVAGHVWGTPDPGVIVPTLHSNLLGTVNVLTAAHQTGARRVIVTGTMMEPDFAGADGVPNSPYAASKWASSVYGRMFHALYDLPVVNLRLFMVYGPGDGDGRKLIPCIIQSLLRREAPPLSSGRWPVDWVYIDDVIDAYLCAAVADGVEGHTFDVGSGQLVPIRRVAEILTGLIGNGVRPRFGVRPDRPNEVARVADVAGAQELLGWRASVRLEEGLRRTIEWHAEQLERRVA